MNNQPRPNKSTQPPRRPVKILFSFLCLFAVMISVPAAAFAQTAKWRYVMTFPDGDKSFLSDEIKSLPNRNKRGWHRVVEPNGSYEVILADWDCPNRRVLLRQGTTYNSVLDTIHTAKMSPKWDEIIPGSMADNLYTRICLPAPPVKWARIGKVRTALRRLPGSDSPIIRIGEPGERFRIVPESEKRNWVNVVDPKTQQDYWLLGKWFETIEEEEPPVKKQNAAASLAAGAKTSSAAKKQKPQPKTKPKARRTKNR